MRINEYEQAKFMKFWKETVELWRQLKSVSLDTLMRKLCIMKLHFVARDPNTSLLFCDSY